MRKLFTLITVSLLCISSLHLSAYNGIKLNSLSEGNRPFVLKPVEDSENGVKSKIIATAGAGLNLFGMYMELRYLASTYYSYEDNIAGHQSSPMINVMVDYGLGKKFSAGIAFGYQTAKVNLKDVVYYGDRYQDNWTRMHFAVRGDYYIVAKENISLYTGAKFGYNMYTVTSNVPTFYYPNYVNNIGVYPSAISAQAHFGFSYFMNGLFGFNAEVGLGWGGPYLAAAGLTIKI